MPEGHGYPNESEQERKQRIKKLKARTSKMRLAAIDKKKKLTNIKNVDFEDLNQVNEQFDLHGEMDSGTDTCLHCKKDVKDSSGEDDRIHHLREHLRKSN